ncbi:MAG: nucleotidyltransferase domain-containing protein [Streptosporangiaceae bacterium]
MVRQALDASSALSKVDLVVISKGSYPNGTNVRVDSDVDIAVVQQRFFFSERDGERSELQAQLGYRSSFRYEGADFRHEVEQALRARFGQDCDCTGKTAITVRESSARVSADVVPSFHFRRCSGTGFFQQCDRGLTTRRADGRWIANYPTQQLSNGRMKNLMTFGQYKKLVRILKRIENELAEDGVMGKLASYFIECLVYNVPSSEFVAFRLDPLTHNLHAVLAHIRRATAVGGGAAEWTEVNGIKPLFGDAQSWDPQQANRLAALAQQRFGLD